MQRLAIARRSAADDIGGVHIAVLDLDEERLTEAWGRFVARMIVRYEERQRAEAVAECILALTLDLDP